ncbi:MAG: extracellular solute-binding protein [Egibacteraceae bacterium]
MDHSRLRFGIIVMLLALVAAACGGGDTPGAEEGGDEAGEPIELTVAANAVRGGKNEFTARWMFDYVIPTFEQQMADAGKDATVEFIESGVDDEDYKSRLALDLQAGEGADVIDVDGFWLSEFATAEFIRPLEEVVGPEINDWEGWEQIPEAVATGVEISGQRYALPVGTDGRVLFFRKDVFNKAGLEEDWQPTSWEEILQAGRQIADSQPDVTPLQINAGVSMGEATTLQGFIPILLGTGADLYTDGGWLGDGPPLQEALGFFDTVYGEGLGDAQLQVRADGRDRSFQEFAEGRIGVLIESDYLWRSVVNPGEGLFPIENRDEVVGYAKIPAMEPGSGIRGQDFVSASGGSARVINPNTEHPQEAWELLSFLGSKEALTEFVEGEPRITARQDVNESPAVTEDPILEYIATEVLPITWYRPGFEEYVQVSEAITRMTENVVADRSDPAGAAQEYEATISGVVGPDNIRAE